MQAIVLYNLNLASKVNIDSIYSYKCTPIRVSSSVIIMCFIHFHFSIDYYISLVLIFFCDVESGCLLPSLPSDVVFDQSAGVSFLCDLNDNIPAPWPATSQLPASSCNKSMLALCFIKIFEGCFSSELLTNITFFMQPSRSLPFLQRLLGKAVSEAVH